MSVQWPGVSYLHKRDRVVYQLPKRVRDFVISKNEFENRFYDFGIDFVIFKKSQNHRYPEMAILSVILESKPEKLLLILVIFADFDFE